MPDASGSAGPGVQVYLGIRAVLGEVAHFVAAMAGYALVGVIAIRRASWTLFYALFAFVIDASLRVREREREREREKPILQNPVLGGNQQQFL